jgi:hypothetical protein
VWADPTHITRIRSMLVKRWDSQADVREGKAGGEGGIRTRCATIPSATCRFYFANVAIDAMVARAAWPILAHDPDSDTSVLCRCHGGRIGPRLRHVDPFTRRAAHRFRYVIARAVAATNDSSPSVGHKSRYAEA